MNLQKTIATALQKRGSLTAADCAEKIEAITERLTALRSRHAEIDDGSGGRPGAEFLRVAETGEPGQLVALSQERESLEYEDVSLGLQRDALTKRQREAERAEVPARLKAAFKKLPGLLTEFERAQRTLDAAKADVTGAHDAIMTLRTAARTLDVPPGDLPKMDSDVFDRLVVITYPDAPAHFTQQVNIEAARARLKSELAGVRTPEQAERDAAAKMQAERAEAEHRGQQIFEKNQAESKALKEAYLARPRV